MLRQWMGRATDILSLGVLIAAAVLLWNRLSGDPVQSGNGVGDLPPNTVIALEAMPVLGTENAGIVVVEFSDFQCPFCRRHVASTFKELKAEFVDTGRIRYAYANNPLERIHPRARDLAAAGLCASRQGRFWAIHDRLFTDDAATDEGLQRLMATSGIDTERFLGCLADRDIDDIIARQKETAKRLNFEGTPAFVIGTVDRHGQLLGTKVVSGLQPIDVFRKVIDTLMRTEP